MFTVRVPQGNPLPNRRAAAMPVMYRAEAPRAPPSATCRRGVMGADMAARGADVKRGRAGCRDGPANAAAA
ncbi:hypothetical protein GCM10011319_22450 [Mameliella alba]|nr:hypothetical protein GCM10011319_22450 [Mameliella alba]